MLFKVIAEGCSAVQYNAGLCPTSGPTNPYPPPPKKKKVAGKSISVGPKLIFSSFFSAGSVGQLIADVQLVGLFRIDPVAR